MNDTTVPTTGGTIAGRSDAGIRRFLGIPYALPPFGEHRFGLPQPVPAWDGEFRATDFGPTAPQSPYPGAIGKLLPSVAIAGENILTLNIWAPEDAAGAPVMVWIHGGALERGTSALPSYDGTSFARDGVVFVSINYRLGAEGFSVLDGVPRNLGLEDAAAAVHWVQREIAAFGGDPARVTIFGESAGGAIVAALASRPDVRGALAGAIVQSGPLDAEPVERAARVTAAIAKHLGIPATREAFADVPPERLVAARDALAARSSLLRSAPGHTIALDPVSLPVSPRTAVGDAEFPLLIGTNTDEYRLWFTPDALQRLNRVAPAVALLGMKVPFRAWRAYRDALPSASSAERLGQVFTDRVLRVPAIELASARSAPTWVYEFAWQSPVRDLRAAHALEIGFVFDGVQDDASIALAGPDAPVSLAQRMHADWVRFAFTGSPGWDTWTADADGPVQRYDVDSSPVPLPRAAALHVLSRS
ncbi:carboxylesterase/lipase family protein [Microbacterium sp. cx-59]|uniref:carboxylesterase/lipase family protein n=1 Tax=Microbacterium sp. cx-59 TaxID=2891207 RepID=UPI001E4AE687|nr:carboxylesterase family protein [Microbacterium sp. cx-59]MCC4907236.1 carboxylesterase family protein [Microbacterium sp. cx-59]